MKYIENWKPQSQERERYNEAIALPKELQVELLQLKTSKQLENRGPPPHLPTSNLSAIIFFLPIVSEPYAGQHY